MVNYTIATFALLIIAVVLTVGSLIILAINLNNNQTSTGTTSGSTTGLLDKLGYSILTTPLKNVLLLDQLNAELFSDSHYENLTLDASQLKLNGFRIFVSGTLHLKNGSKLIHNGENGESNDRGKITKGGLGAKTGSLGGGGQGGDGCTQTGGFKEQNGGDSLNSYWEPSQDPSLFQGQDGTSNANVAKWKVGQGGKVITHPYRAFAQLLQALDPNANSSNSAFLSGGSGGGGGQGSRGYPGSGGGGGGGVILIVAKSFKCSGSDKVKCKIEARGGDSGKIIKNGNVTLENATSTYGGGGGGGFVIISTESPPSDYSEHLEIDISGGFTIPNKIRASPGKVLWWSSSSSSFSSSLWSATELFSVSNSSPQTIDDSIPTSIEFAKLNYSIGSVHYVPQNKEIIIGQSGFYSIRAKIKISLTPLNPNSKLEMWLEQNHNVHMKYAFKDGPIEYALDLEATMILAKDDRVVLKVLQTSGSSLSIGTPEIPTSLDVRLISYWNN